MTQPSPVTTEPKSEEQRLADLSAVRRGGARLREDRVRARGAVRRRARRPLGLARAWLRRQSSYMRDGDRADPRSLLPSARTIIAVALPYGGRPVALRRSRDEGPLTGRIAAYAGARTTTAF